MKKALQLAVILSGFVAGSSHAADDPCTIERITASGGNQVVLVNCYLEQAVAALKKQRSQFVSERHSQRSSNDERWHAIDYIDNKTSEIEAIITHNSDSVDIRDYPERLRQAETDKMLDLLEKAANEKIEKAGGAITDAGDKVSDIIGDLPLFQKDDKVKSDVSETQD